jgi:hypothetical protein
MPRSPSSAALAHADIPRLKSIADALPRCSIRRVAGHAGQLPSRAGGVDRRVARSGCRDAVACGAVRGVGGARLHDRGRALTTCTSRSRAIADARSAGPPIAPLAWRIDRMVLFESVTAGAGPRYDALATWALDAR